MTNKPFKPGDDVLAGNHKARILAQTEKGTLMGEILTPDPFGAGASWSSAVWSEGGINVFYGGSQVFKNENRLDLRHKDFVRYICASESTCTRFSLLKWDADSYRLGADVALEDMTREQWTSLMEFLIECYRKESTQ